MRATVVKFGLFTLVSLLFIMLLFNTMTNPVDGETDEFSAVFSDVSGLRPGDDVRVAGVKVGRVETIEVEGRHARVGFVLSSDQPLLSTSGLVMRYQNLLGQRYLAVTQGPHRGERLEDGATIPLSRTSPGFDLTALLNGFRPLFDVLRPEDINKLSESVIKVLQGEGGTVEMLLRQTASLTDFLADREQLFDEVVTNLTPVLDNLSGQGTQLRATVGELDKLMTGLARNRLAFGRSLDSVIDLASTVSSLLSQARRPVVRDVRAIRQVAAMYAEQSQLFGSALAAFGGVLGDLGKTLSYRSALNAYFCTLDMTVNGVRIGTHNMPQKHSAVCR